MPSASRFSEGTAEASPQEQDLIRRENDLTAAPEIAKAYSYSIKAPRKVFYLLPGTGHTPSADELCLLHRVLLEANNARQDRNP
jgi:hypothetical protein